MGFPEPERFTINDLAKRWKKSDFQVEELIRAYKFKHVILESIVGGLPLTVHRYFDRALWPFGESNHKNISSGEVAYFWPTDGVPKDLKWSEKGTSVYIPQKAVKAFEEEHAIKPDPETAAPPSGKFGWIRSKRLRIAVEAYYDLYEQKKLRPGQAHKTQIRAWLDTNQPKLSNNTKNLISTLVNPNEEGGAPPSG